MTLSPISAGRRNLLDTWTLPQDLLGNLWTKRLHAYDTGWQRHRAKQPASTRKEHSARAALWEEPWHVSQAGQASVSIHPRFQEF